MREQAVERPLDGARSAQLRDALDALAATARAELQRRASRAERIAVAARAPAYEGTDTALVVPLARRRRDARRVRGALPPALRFLMPGARAGRRGGRRSRRSARGDAAERGASPASRPRAGAVRRSSTVPHVQRRQLAATPRLSRATTCGPATRIDGPGDHRRAQRDHGRRAAAGARDVDRAATTWCSSASQPRDARARDRHRRRSGACSRCSTTSSWRSPSRWACALQNTAYSVNIKERLDFSCALFDADGNLIANAPHMPVHLGSMGESDQDGHRARTRGTMQPRRRVRAERPVQRRHAPARRHGGHAGVRSTSAASARPVLRRARAATTPTSAASRPARCRRLDARRGRGRADRQRASWSTAAASSRPRCARCSPAARYPARNPSRTSPTCRRRSPPARRASQELRRMVAHFGLDVVQAYMRTCRTTPRRRCAA